MWISVWKLGLRENQMSFPVTTVVNGGQLVPSILISKFRN